MKRKRKGLKGINRAHDIINSGDYKNQFRKSERDFSRNRKISFVVVIMFLINFLSKSLTSELRFFSNNTKIVERVTKQAISKARKKIKPEAFQYLYEDNVKFVMEDPDYFLKYNGFRIFAIDGSEIFIEPTIENISNFGQKEKRNNCKAKISTLIDVQDGYIIHAGIGRYDKGEREFAEEHIKYLDQFKSKKDLIIFDRGYPSKRLIALLEEKGFKYLFRVRRKFNTRIDKSTQEDFYIDFEKDGKSFKMRVLKLTLPSGETETLITNLARNQFKKAEFLDLYFMRWSIETQYDTLKNKLEIESFSGRTYESVMQDFWATLFLSNIVSLMKVETDEEIESKKNEECKVEYQTNEKELINILKWKLVVCLLNKSSRMRSKIFKEIVAEASSLKSEKRPGRSFVRDIVPKKSIKRKRKPNL
jgi:hypothetical protein